MLGLPTCKPHSHSATQFSQVISSSPSKPSHALPTQTAVVYTLPYCPLFARTGRCGEKGITSSPEPGALSPSISHRVWSVLWPWSPHLSLHHISCSITCPPDPVQYSTSLLQYGRLSCNSSRIFTSLDSALFTLPTRASPPWQSRYPIVPLGVSVSAIPHPNDLN